MKWLNGDKLRSAIVGVVAAIVVSGGNARADFTFGEPVNLGPTVNSPWWDDAPCISADGLELYLVSQRANGIGIWVSTRNTTDDEWGPPENLGPVVNGPLGGGAWQTAISTDGLELYIQVWERAATGSTYTSGEIWVTRRVAKGEPWGEPVKLDLTVPGWDLVSAPSLTADGLELYFGVNQFADDGNRADVHVTKRETMDAPWGEPVSLGPVVNDWTCQADPRISSDGLLVIFADWWACSSRPGGFGDVDMWMVRRSTRDGDWGSPVNLGPAINSVFEDRGGTISADGSTLYFHSDRCGGSGRSDLWQAPILPVVDFDDDGIVGMSDLLAMIGSLGTNEPLCDIGPMPWGDGVVDEADLEVLMDYWGQDVTAKPVAHWTFDEAEGMTAYDSAGTSDANLVGDPVWQTTGGIIDGALEFDGIDDYVDTPYQMDPYDSFSISTWVKGGGLNQVIIAPTVGPILLQADHVEGNLMTAFMFYTDDFLFSQTQIIDGQWHHVGLVWDASAMTRTLYVDGVEVAAGTVTKCPYHGSGRLQIGTWDSPSTGLWSGLIDDVRVYKGALTAEQIAALVQ